MILVTFFFRQSLQDQVVAVAFAQRRVVEAVDGSACCSGGPSDGARRDQRPGDRWRGRASGEAQRQSGAGKTQRLAGQGIFR